MPKVPPEFTTIPLERGWTLHHRSSDRFKTELLRVFLRGPLEGPASARQLYANVLSRGTHAHPTRRELALALQKLWGAGFGVACHRMQDRNVLALRASTVSGRFLPGEPQTLADLMRFMASALEGPPTPGGAIAENVLEPERRELLRDYRARKDDKGRFAAERTRELLYGADHILAKPATGDEAEILGTTSEDILSAGQEFVTRGEGDIYVLSPSTAAQAERMVRRHLNLSPRTKEKKSSVSLPPRRARMRRVNEVMDVEQGKLVMAFRLDGPVPVADRTLAALADVILGGSSSSKLFRNVREKESLCYDVRSHFDAAHGVLYVLLGVEREHADQAIAAVRREVSALCKGQFATEDVLTAKRQMLTSVESVADTQNGLVEFFYQRRLQGRREKTIPSIANGLMKADSQRIPEIFEGLKLETVYLLGREPKGKGNS